MNIEPINVVIVPAQSTQLSKIELVHVWEDYKKKTLKVLLEGNATVFFQPAEYDALGQWTDASLKEAIRIKLGATVLPPS